MMFVKTDYMMAEMQKYTFIEPKFKIKFMLLLTFCCINLSVNAQKICDPPCFPDILCKELGKPGQICPVSIPVAFLGKYYNEIFTIIPPDTYSIGFNFGSVNITKIVILEVEGLPEGVVWSKSTDTFRVAEPVIRYCCRFEGTPKQCGEFQLKLKVKPYFMFFGKEISPIVVMDKTLTIRVVNH